MQISQATKIELALLIHGLRSFILHDEKQTAAQQRLLQQLENELSQRYGESLKA